MHQLPACWMPCHTPDSCDTRNYPQPVIAIWMNTQIHNSYDFWWELGARELLRVCNLETIKCLFHFELLSDWQLLSHILLECSPLHVDGLLDELGVSHRNPTHAEKVSIIISVLEDEDAEDVDTDDEVAEDEDAGDEDAEDEILDYILQLSDEKAVAKYLLELTSPKWARIHFVHLVRCITQAHPQEVDHNHLVRILCARLRRCPDQRPMCDRLKKVRLNRAIPTLLLTFAASSTQ